MDSTKQLGEENIFKLLLKFSIPAIVGMLINSIYNIVDRMFIGQHPDLSTLGLAGITISFPLVTFIMAVSILFGMGGSILFSIRLGQNERHEAEKTLATTYTLLAISSIIITVLGLIFLNPILKIFGADAEVIPFAKDYMQIIFIGSIFQSLGLGINNFIRSDGFPKTAMFTMIIGALVNIILDPIFIFALDMGIQGAAYATIIGQACSAIWVILHFSGKKCTIKYKPSSTRLFSEISLKICSLGLSGCLLQLALCLLTIILNKSIAVYGAESPYGSIITVSSLGIINSLVTLLILPVIGINQGSQPIISYNYGAGNMARVKKTLLFAILCATVMLIIGYLVTLLIPTQLITLFNDDPALIEFSLKALKIWFLFTPIVGFQIVGSNYFQSIGKVKHAIFLSTSRQIIFLIPLICILPKFFGLDGILYATPIADVLSVCVTGLFLFIDLKNVK